MTALEDLPDTLKPYAFHKLDFDYKPRKTQVLADCPFCGKEQHFSVKVKTSQFNCLLCSESGNAIEFIRKLWDYSDKNTTDYREFSKDRSLCLPDTLMHWGVARSVICSDWLLPGYTIDGRISQVYRYVRIKGGKYRLLATPTFNLGLFGMNLFNHNCEQVFLCEGPWDAMVLWEMLGHAAVKSTHGSNGDTHVNLKGVADVQSSLLETCSVLGVPGCNSFSDAWANLFGDRVVNLMFDNDHPPKNKSGLPPSVAGMRRIAGILSIHLPPPKSIRYLCWSGKPSSMPYYDPELGGGYDLRDKLSE